MPKYEYYYSDDESLDENIDNNIDLDEENEKLFNEYVNFNNYLKENNCSILNKLSFDDYINYL